MADCMENKEGTFEKEIQNGNNQVTRETFEGVLPEELISMAEDGSETEECGELLAKLETNEADEDNRKRSLEDAF